MGRWSSFDSFEKTNLTLSAGVIGASLIFAPPMTLGVVVGVLIEAVNFRGLRTAANSLFQGVLPTGAMLGLFALRFAFLGGATAVAIWSGVHPLGLVLGLSTAVPAVFIAAWRSRAVMQNLDGPVAVVASDDPSWDRWNVWRACEDPEPEPMDDWGVPDASDFDANLHRNVQCIEILPENKENEGIERKKGTRIARWF